jgi:hypothetical protein
MHTIAERFGASGLDGGKTVGIPSSCSRHGSLARVGPHKQHAAVAQPDIFRAKYARLIFAIVSTNQHPRPGSHVPHRSHCGPTVRSPSGGS